MEGLQNSASKRKQMYKKQAPQWKDVYRKRCQERLKGSRDKFLTKFRHSPGHSTEQMVKDLMVEEWKAMCSEDSRLPSISKSTDYFEFEFQPDENLEEVLYVFEEIQSELIQEEQHILEEYEASLCHDENSLQSSVRTLESATVICPVCQKNPLHLNKGVVFCQCGVRIDTEQDCISLEHVDLNLQQAVQAHSELCDTQPGFGVVNQLGVGHNLILSCKVCDYMHIII